MPESRDRFLRPVDISAVFSGQRSEGVGILVDNQEAGESVNRSLILRGMGTPALRTPIRTRLTRVDASARERFGALRTSESRPSPTPYRSPAIYLDTMVGSSRRGTGRSTNSILPSWYPRTPLHDITAVVRAIERRRARLGENENEGQQYNSPIFTYQRVLDPAVSASDVLLEHKFSSSPTFEKKHSLVGKVPKILLGITKQASESELLTPQKRLLKSIDTVETMVLQELQKLKRTPSAKKAEREKRVRTLMSMR